MTKIYSHPPEDGEDGKKLIDHLRETASRVDEFVPEDAETPGGESLRDLSHRVALVHDIAKATSYFQNYILSDEDPGKIKNHSPLGGYVADYVLEKSGYSECERLAGYLTVSAHHGRLPNAGEYVRKKTSKAIMGSEEHRQRVVKQAEDILDNENSISVVREVIDEATDGKGSWKEFMNELSEGDRFEKVNSHAVSRYGSSLSPPDNLYSTELQLWSTLIFADKTDAAGINRKEYVAEYLDLSTLDSHVESLPEGMGRERELNRSRNDAREDVLGNVEGLVEGDYDVGTITLPTGLGKTYTGISAAMKVRDMKNGSGRVVYALPFTSIIDQLVDDVKNVFNIGIKGKELTVHHHLSETVIETENTDEDASEEYMLGESWRSGMVVTTFVQLFESLSGPRNQQSMKIPSLYNSVIVLDEPQALPHHWWRLIRRLVRMLIEEYNATVIAMTATQPRIFEQDMKTLELVSNVRDYFDASERVEYVLHPSVDHFFGEETEAVEYETAAKEVVETEASSVLSVCNTIDSAEQLTDEVERATKTVNVNKIHGEYLEDEDIVTETVEEVSQRVVNQECTAVAHLTTRLRPKDRLEIIKVAKKLTEMNISLVVVSTQLIEAGVDISFGKVYRDFAPMDSIVQAAGRCNRSFENEISEVCVWWLDAPEGLETTPSKAVYSVGRESILPVAGKAINQERASDSRRLSDSTMARDVVERYYRDLQTKGLGSEDLVEMFEDAEAEDLGRESMIRDRKSIDIIICRTKEEEEMIEEIRDARKNREYSKARSLLDETKNLRVSIPLYSEETERAVSNIPELVGEDYPGLRVMKVASSESNQFDPKKGFVVQDDSIEHRFL